MKLIKSRKFANGEVFLLETHDGFPVEVTDTFLPYYTKDAVSKKQNKLKDSNIGSRLDRWMIGISCMSGCPVGCKFCATGKLKKWGPLTSSEMLEQVEFVLSRNSTTPSKSREFKINYTRMGEPFLNIENVKEAIAIIDDSLDKCRVHHYISTIGVKGSDFGWIKENTTLQVSLHSLDSERRDSLIPYTNKLSIPELGGIRTQSSLKTTLNLTLVDELDWDMAVVKENFDPSHFFIKLSPINPNEISDVNLLGAGIIEGVNLV